ncbi:MAG: DNA polymerase III subunit epsilon [Salinarimonadaceae bacterium]|nr:MAG: DNA polymerase III subunit epsilon [Salinarimonadaceae bacterium]
MLREIVLDTETTGTDHGAGDRVIEIGCVELVNHIPTGEFYHRYINPERPVSAGALAVHGLTDEFLADKQLFAEIADEFADFIRDSRLVIHNAAFDVGFLNAEFARTGHPRIENDRVLDTLALARRKHPGAPNNLDALCNRYGIDNTRRTKHGALLDAEILAEVYIELIGGKQTDLGLAVTAARASVAAHEALAGAPSERRVAPPRLSDAEREAHARFLAGFKSEPIWRDYIAGE